MSVCGAAAAHASVHEKTRLESERRAGCTGRVHPEHLAHDLDAGRVEVHRLVELKRVLSSRKEGMRCAGRGASRKAPEL